MRTAHRAQLYFKQGIIVKQNFTIYNIYIIYIVIYTIIINKHSSITSPK